MRATSSIIFLLWFSLYLIIVSEPYRHLNYDRINVYDLTDEQVERAERRSTLIKDFNSIFCYFCSPPRWVDEEEFYAEEDRYREESDSEIR